MEDISSQLLAELNTQQQNAVQETEGYICLHAGAGTGKTRTLTYRYAYLLSAYGIAPQALWAVTFTNRAAEEMRARVRKLCGSLVGNPFITTFHGFCALFLRDEITAVGWPKTFTIADVRDVYEILKPILEELKIDGKRYPLRKVWAFIDATKEDQKDYVPAFVGADSTELLRRSEQALDPLNKIFWRYLFAQRTTYTLDFDDLIILTLHILKSFPEVRERWQERFNYILVDEFQDIDGDQYDLVEILSHKVGNLFVVGDPDQTIYSFRGARVDFFNDFIINHPENSQRLFLTQNYRSSAPILTAAYDVISNNGDEIRKPLIAMRQDITPEQMVLPPDPKLVSRSRKEQDLLRQVQAKANLPQGLSKLTSFSGRQVALPASTGSKSTPPLSLAPAERLKPFVVHCGSVYSEADYVVETIKLIQKLAAGDTIAVLYRAHYQSMELENDLIREHIPYTIFGDVRFYDRKEIRDLLAYIRLRLNLDDDAALRRVVNVPPRRFGSKRMEQLELWARQEHCSLFQALVNHQNDSLIAKGTSVGAFIAIMKQLQAEPLDKPLVDLEKLLSMVEYEEYIKTRGEDERLENIAAFKSYLHNFEQQQDEAVNLADFINNVALLTPSDDAERNGVASVRLMTVHNAKGLEFDYVFVVGLNEAVFPSRKSISEQNVAEERRLMYVAMTRAQKQLFLLEAGGTLVISTGTLGDKQRTKAPREPSRFLLELQEGHYNEMGTCGLLNLTLAQLKERLARGETREQLFGESVVLSGNGSSRAQGATAALNNTLNSKWLANSSACKFTAGMRVFHHIMGNGTIEEVLYDSQALVIAFDKLKSKRTLNWNMKLEILDQPTTATAAPALATTSESVEDTGSSAMPAVLTDTGVSEATIAPPPMGRLMADAADFLDDEELEFGVPEEVLNWQQQAQAQAQSQAPVPAPIPTPRAVPAPQAAPVRKKAETATPVASAPSPTSATWTPAPWQTSGAGQLPSAWPQGAGAVKTQQQQSTAHGLAPKASAATAKSSPVSASSATPLDHSSAVMSAAKPQQALGWAELAAQLKRLNPEE